MEFVADTRRDLQRWLLCGCIVLMAHGGLAAGAVYWHNPDDDVDPTAALVIDLAPMPVSPADTLPIPPGPEQIQAEASPQRPVEKVEEKPEEVKEVKEVQQEQPVLPPVVDPEVAMAALPPEVQKETPKAAEQQMPAPATTAPQAPKLQEAARAAAPTQGQVRISNSDAVPNWKRKVSGLLERNQRYPSQARGQRGIVQLSFNLDPQGRVTATKIAKSSGSSTLDEAALDLIQRTQPFPPPPPEMMASGQLNVTVPIRFGCSTAASC